MYGPIQPSGMDHPPYGAKRRGCPFSPAADDPLMIITQELMTVTPFVDDKVR